MEYHGEECAPTYLTLYESLILFGFFQMSRFPKQVAVLREMGVFQEGYWNLQLYPQVLPNQSKWKAVTNHFNTSADHIYPTATFLHQGPHRRTFFKRSFLYKASPDPVNTSVLTGRVVYHHSQLHAVGWSLYSSSLHPPGPVRQESCDKMLGAWLRAWQDLTSAFTPWILLPSAVKNLAVPVGEENTIFNYDSFSQQK